MQTDAVYYDGESAGSSPARLTLLGHNLSYQIASTSGSFDIQNLTIIEPVGKGAWVIELDGGASFRFDNIAFAELLAETRGDFSLIRRLEGAWLWAVAALVVAVAFTWLLLTYGVPAGARYVAFAIPEDLNDVLRDDSLGILDRVLFEASELPDESKQRVERLFVEIQEIDNALSNYELKFRASNIGANAFAVPGGIVVMTDEMVEIAANDDELSAVLAHEVGHLYNRHILRVLLQNSASALIIAGLTGDLSSITSLSAAVPAVLMQAKYSRDFEIEADTFAFRFLDSKGISTNVLSELLLRIEGTSHSDVPGWLSTHPQTKERVPEDR